MNPDQTVSLRLRSRGLKLEYATVAWNVGEAVITLTLGSIAGSIALLGFGAVSVVEVFASSVVVWYLRRPGGTDLRSTALALRLIAVTFASLSLAISFVAANDLASGHRAEESPVGIAYLALTAVVMFSLATAKRRTALKLGSGPSPRRRPSHSLMGCSH
jgi:divalent metal cation (Fe/Co/Zn/Cd) transporter